ncbi:MAG TPA: hypothetical protein VKZ87_09060 [Ferrovibrio sp.]|uniref:hypothetical protein n=1 Tax=Ferrovibrio sp. TaxID=1917215 RepID=UPI002B4B72C6|nr:hypothetical protein [Ferrovibrio sp.]HLT77522.1 hypothetical protein [Ferrovibrio sp.]
MSDQPALPRRDFLRTLGTVSTAAAAAAVIPVTAGDAQAYNPGQEETRARYQPDSPDVQAFYRTNGYETLKK